MRRVVQMTERAAASMIAVSAFLACVTVAGLAEGSSDASPTRAGTYVVSVQVGRDAGGRDVLVKVECAKSPTYSRCALIDAPLATSRVERPLAATLPQGTQTADQWGHEIVISTSNIGEVRYSSRNAGTFELLRSGGWKRLSRQVATTIEIRGHTLLADLEQTTGGIIGPSTLEIFDLTRSTSPRKLAYHPADFGYYCREVSPCSTYQAVHLDTRYAYWLELNLVGNGSEAAPQSVICREEINTSARNLSRWISPRPLTGFTTTLALGLLSAPAEPGEPTMIYHESPRWSPATVPLASESGGPCATQSTLATY